MLLQADPALSSKLKFRFYLLPSPAAPRRLCASYLCAADPWFAKTVSAGLRGPVACVTALAPTPPPTAAAAVATSDTPPPAAREESLSETMFHLPPLVLHSMLSDYMLARHTNRLKVYSLARVLVFAQSFFARCFNASAGKNQFPTRTRHPSLAVACLCRFRHHFLSLCLGTLFPSFWRLKWAWPRKLDRFRCSTICLLR